MLMCVYRHYSKGLERHAQREKRRREKCVERETGKKEVGERVPVLSVTDGSRGCVAQGFICFTTTQP